VSQPESPLFPSTLANLKLAFDDLEPLAAASAMAPSRPLGLGANTTGQPATPPALLAPSGPADAAGSPQPAVDTAQPVRAQQALAELQAAFAALDQLMS
jgi:hypothetical protein